jgi:L-ascorbate metabolism protein UlaG (beta-lactamase superfamily)
MSEQPRDAQGRFVNLDGSGPHGLGDVLRWMVLDRLQGRRRRSPARAPVPRVEPARTLVATPSPGGAGARLTWIGHASFLLQLDGVSLLVDPVLEGRISGFIERNVEPGLGYRDLPRIDAALVTHCHYDHLDLPTLRRVGAPVVAGLGLGPLFARAGLSCTELGWWQEVPLRGVRIRFVPAQHWSRRGLSDTNRTLWGGFVVEGSSAAIYHSGDTAWFDGFAEIGRRFPGIDAALLPIGAYDPPWFMERQHLNPEQALRAFQALGARRLVPMHWGTFKLTDEPLDEPPRRLEAERARLGVDPEAARVVAIGETIAIAPRRH